MMPNMYPYHWGWMAIWLVFWILIIAGLFFIIRAFMEKRTDTGKSAMDILNERYARGEITRDEYNERKRDILGG